MASDIIAQSHVIILGRHKSGNSTCEFLRKYDNLEEIIFATSKISIDEETYKYYIDKGTDIYFEVWEKELYVE